MRFVSSFELATLGQQEKTHCIHTQTHTHPHTHTAFQPSPILVYLKALALPSRFPVA